MLQKFFKKQVICQSSEKWICKSGNGLFGTCVVPRRGEVWPKKNWINYGMAKPCFDKKGLVVPWIGQFI